MDYGDAPDLRHRTLLAHDGARHVIDGVHYLGSRIDGEADGNPSVTTSGDDLSGPKDDEDGAWFTSSLNPGNTAFLIVEASTKGYLDAWVDADGDNTWTGASEQIFIAQPLGKGFNTLSFTVPNGSSEGTTFSRFRFSSAGFLPPTGVAADGEVEDHWVRILTAFTAVLKTDTIKLHPGARRDDHALPQRIGARDPYGGQRWRGFSTTVGRHHHLRDASAAARFHHAAGWQGNAGVGCRGIIRQQHSRENAV